MARLHLHLLSDSTGETLEMIAKAALAQFDDADVMRHFWPMVRSQQHLDRIMGEITANPGLVLFTMVNAETRARLQSRCAELGLPSVPALDAVTLALEAQLGQAAKGRPGRQHAMDEAYFRRVEAIQFTIAHDDGIASGGLGSSRYSACRGLAQFKDTHCDLPCQSGLPRREHSHRRGKPAAVRAVQLAAAVGGRAHHKPGKADSGAPQSAALA